MSMKEQFLFNRLPVVGRFSHLARRAYRFYEGRQFRWPIYDLSRYFINREPKKIYRRERTRMAPNSVEKKIIQELREDGISIIQLSDLFPPQTFIEIRQWAEGLIREPKVQERIKTIKEGARPDSKAGKFYVVRPLGDFPVVDLEDAVMKMSLSDSVLRIICGYLGMLGRLAAIDLWYNMPTNGPDIKSQLWHRDPEDRRIVKAFLYLRDVDETNGPFCYIPRTHNGGPFKNIYPQKVAGGTYPKGDILDKTFPPDQRQICTGKAGTLIFCDTTGFHRGGNPTSGARFLFNAVYTTNAAAPIIVKSRQYSLGESRGNRLSPAAGYAIGHLEDR
jgi:hypothetical protein